MDGSLREQVSEDMSSETDLEPAAGHGLARGAEASAATAQVTHDAEDEAPQRRLQTAQPSHPRALRNSLTLRLVQVRVGMMSGLCRNSLSALSLQGRRQRTRHTRASVVIEQQ